MSKTTLAAIQIDSIKTTPSNCPNNGSITVYARNTTPGGALFYSISGTVTEPTQTNNIFNSLPAGSYTIVVSDGGAGIATKDTFITGNYIPLDFNPITKGSYCAGGSNGQIIGNRTAGTGNGPFIWQLIGPSAVATAPQISDTFNNLSAGNDTIRLTDACGSYRTVVATITDPPSATLNFAGYSMEVEMINCGSAIATLLLYTPSFRSPLSYTFETSNGTFTTTTPTAIDTSQLVNGGGNFTVQEILPNFTYGDYLRATVKNSCGYSATSQLGYTETFNFCAQPNSNFSNCKYLTQVTFGINQTSCIGYNNIATGLNLPVTYQLVNTVTSEVIDSGTIAGDPAHNVGDMIFGITTKPLENGSYYFTITDGCGNTFSTPYTIVNSVTPSPKIESVTVSKDACIDSVATGIIAVNYFKSLPFMIMLSGPSNLGSTKPGYAYHDTYKYPDTLAYSEWGGGYNSRYEFYIKNLTIGKYYFSVFDTCGDVIMDSITVAPSDVIGLSKNIWYKKGCLGQNQLYYSYQASSGNITIVNVSSGITIANKYYGNGTNIYDSVLNVPSGTYQFVFTYSTINGTPANDSIHNCQISIDTVVIAGYQTPQISTSNSVICHNTVTTELIPDSTKGVPPYEYEIVSPQAFPEQESNIFSLTAGTYIARIFDVCGNASTKQITIDSIAFPPINSILQCNGTKLFYGSSAYYTYTWTKPNGTIYIGDTLTIDPIIPIDTGIYTIKKIVNISGCTDSFFTSYHLALPHFSKRDTSICTGDSISFGSHTYNTTGHYTDTLTNGNGCDSLVQLNLTVNDYKRNVIIKTICAGGSFTVNGHVYTKKGAYFDTLSTATCDSVVILALTVDSNCTAAGVCSGATHTVWKDDFGSGIPINGGASPNVNPAYLDQNNGVGPGSYSLLNYFNYQTCCWHKVPEDHTPDDAGGYFLVVDGGVPNFYSTRINNLCPYTNYTFSAWTMNMDLPAYPSQPTFIFDVTDTLGNEIGQLATPPIPVQATPTWVNNGFTFNSGNNTSLKLNLILTSAGYNDFAFDDLELSVCGPTLSLTPTVVPCSDKVQMIANLGSGYINPVYQWYKKDNDSNWQATVNATSSTYTDSMPLANNWYKVTVRDGVSSCSFVEDSIQVTLTKPSLDTVNTDSIICNGQSVFGHTTSGTYSIDTIHNSAGCDSVVRMLNLTVNNCVVTSSSCKGAMVLHGDDEGLLPLPDTNYYSANGFTWECWFYSDWYNNTNGTSTYGQSLMMSEDPVVCEDINLGFGWHSYPRNAIGFNVDGPGGCGNSDGNPCYYAIPGGFQPDTWYHVAAVKDYTNNTTSLYLNGILVDTKPNTKLPFTRDITTRLGTEPVGGDSAFNGKIDEIRIWNYPRTAAQINANYNQCLTGNEPGLVVYYRANEVAGSIAHDATPNHRDAILDPTVSWDKTINAPLINSCSSPTTSTIDTSICQAQNYLGHDTTGTYIDTLTNVAGCDSIRTLKLTVYPKSSTIIDTAICAGQNYLGYDSTNTYINTLTNIKGCDSIVTVKLTVNPNPAIKIIPGNTIVNRGDVIQLNVSPSFNYLWTDAKAIFNNDTIQNPFATINDSSWIYVTATDTAVNCSSVDSVFIALRQASTTLPCNGASSIRMPNAFDPDCHCINNKFTIIGTNIVLNEFQIFNRWGEMVYETKDITKGWDGTYNGGMLEGAYVYWISYFECNETTPKILKGTVILIK